MKLTSIQIYLSDQGSVRRIHCPVKIAAGQLPISSHNFAWRGVINHDRATKLNLQSKYDPILPAWHPKVAYPLEISLWIRIYSHTVRHFPAASPSTAQRSTVDSTLFTVTSSPGQVNHVITIMTLHSFTEFWTLYCPRTMHFSERRRASLRTLPTSLIGRDWGNNGTICNSTCAARCRLLDRLMIMPSDECHWHLLMMSQHWCCQATSHYQCQCWPRVTSPYGITRLQWVDVRIAMNVDVNFVDNNMVDVVFQHSLLNIC